MRLCQLLFLLATMLLIGCGGPVEKELKDPAPPPPPAPEAASIDEDRVLEPAGKQTTALP